MNQEGNKNIKNLVEKREEEKKEEKEFLSRGEIKTMEKDVSNLREDQAAQQRERVAKIKTEEELKKREERQVAAEKAGLARELAEKEAERKKEQLERLKKERKTKEAVLEKAEVKKEEIRAEGLKGALKETQIKEEEERKKFMERVEAKAGGEEEASIMPLKPPELPLSLPTPPVKKPAKFPKLPSSLLKKPSFAQKLWIRIVLSLLVIAILAAIGTFWYWYAVVRETATSVQESPPIEKIEQKELIVPLSLISAESSQSLKYSEPSKVPYLVFQALKEKVNQGSFNRILIEDTENIEILGMEAFFGIFSITPPSGFYNKLENDFTLFIYSQEEGNRLGFVAKIENKEGLKNLLSSWEETMEADFENVFIMFGKNEPAAVSYFKTAEYQETDFRFQTFSREDLGIVYSIYNDYFIFTTSWKSMEKILEKLKEMPFSVFFSPNSGAEFILEKMTLEEKVGQLFLMGIEGKTITPSTKRLINSVRPGGVILLKKNIENESQTKKLTRALQTASLKNNGIPLLIAVDQEGGLVFPINFCEEKTPPSALKNSLHAYEVGLARGAELRELGINLNLSPVLDVTSPGDFLFSRSFQKDPEETSELAKALISGQKEASILTAVKHFPGYGNLALDPEKQLAVLSEVPETRQFQKTMEAKPELVMVSNVIYSDVDSNLPFALSPNGIKLLKQKLGDDCIIITDDLPQDHLLNKFSLKGMVTLPILAGVDILTFTGWLNTAEEAVKLLVEAVRNNEIDEDKINASVLKIIKLKQSLSQ